MKQKQNVFLMTCAAALLLTACSITGNEGLYDTEPQIAESVPEQADAAEPAAAAVPESAEIMLPDLSAFGIDTGAFTRCDEPEIRTYGEHSEREFSGDLPTEQFTVYKNERGDRLFFDGYGRLRGYSDRVQTSWNYEPEHPEEPEDSGTYYSSFQGTLPSGSDLDSYLIKYEESDGNGGFLRSVRLDESQLRSEQEYRDTAYSILNAVVPDFDLFTDREEKILYQYEGTSIFVPCSVSASRSYAEYISDKAYVDLKADGTLESFSIEYADIADPSASDTLHNSAAELCARCQRELSPDFIRISEEESYGYCANIGGQLYGFFTFTCEYGDPDQPAYGCYEYAVRGD
ncbi:MAG: hypothetical protein K5705_07000 [Oscillospiraceae bacterium]|nr:hypothetical protein [Oscillospiraceae bacterium]